MSIQSELEGLAIQKNFTTVVMLELADLFPALAVVHNLVRRLDPDSDIDVSENVVFTNDAVDDVVPPPASKAVTKKAASARDRVARRMWKKYERN
ncbi:unnamed protein product [Tilletia controversa]|nr:hypothetical protein CF328_g5754 [Tilletia controversa]CAD6976120.1 unnamed protein product [Tilletia controversa]